jgi:hypothetical protein
VADSPSSPESRVDKPNLKSFDHAASCRPLKLLRIKLVASRRRAKAPSQGTHGESDHESVFPRVVSAASSQLLNSVLPR